MTASLRLSRRDWLVVVLLVALALLCLVGASSARAAGCDQSVDHIAIAVSSRTPAVGEDLTVTAVAKDASNNTCFVSGTGLWNDNAGALAPVKPYTYVNFLYGKATIVAHLDKPLHNDVINVFFDLGEGKTSAFNVLGPLDHLTTSIPSQLKVGSPFNVTISARDAVNNLLTGYTGALSWSDSAGALPSPSAFAGGVSKTSVQLSAPVRNDRVTITTGGLSVIKALNVIGPVTKLDLQAPSSVAAAAPLKVVARARDAAGNVVSDYNAPASWSDGAGALTPSAPSDFVKGVSTTTAQFPVPVKSDVITLASGAMSAHRIVTAIGPFDHVNLTWTTASAGWTCSPVTGSLIARALDAAGNLVTSYNDASPSWLVYEGNSTIAPAKPAPFVSGISNNPSVTVTQTDAFAVDVWMITGGRTWTVRACG